MEQLSEKESTLQKTLEASKKKLHDTLAQKSAIEE